MMEILSVLGYSFFVMAAGLLYMGIGRKIAARLHRRYGPPVWQCYIDVVKCFSRRSISHNFIMDLGSMMGLSGLLAAAMFIPMASFLPFPSQGPIIVILYLMPIGYLGMAMGVSASGNPLAAIGIGRALTLMMGYEVPFAMIVLTFVASFSSTSLVKLQELQAGGIMNWHMVTMPIGFAAALIALMGMLGKKPFDTMIAPSEIASGPMVELSGKFLGLAFLQHATAIFVETGLIVIMFLGGASNVFEFVAKQALVYIVMASLSELWARYRVEQATKFLWISAGSLALVQLIVNMAGRK
ncbi:MAG: NADH dehydrogenase [Spirochaetes bacterium GWF1_51_8]|nr:MAG: NADH dehydrogenase [Spirochaetes bacterium GWF1_51_8]